MSLLGLPTPPNRKHLLDFRNFPKALRTHPRISNFFPNHGVGFSRPQFYSWLSFQQLLVCPHCGFIRRLSVPSAAWATHARQGGEADKSGGGNTAKSKADFLVRAGFLAFLVVLLALLGRMEPLISTARVS